MGRQSKISKDALNNTEVLIKKYIAEFLNERQKMERTKLTDELTIALTGLSMLMTERDKSKAVNIIDDYGLSGIIKNSALRIRSNNTLAFT